MSEGSSSDGRSTSWWRMPLEWWSQLATLHPFIAFFVVIVWPNAVWSIANLVYNQQLIMEPCTPRQKEAFWNVAAPFYTALTWSLGMAICVWLIQPLREYFRAVETGTLTPALKEVAQRRLVNLPWYQLLCNFLLWMPGGIYFPVMVCSLGGWDNWSAIAVQFLASFTVSAVVTTFQTFVTLERFLLVYLYPFVFSDVSPVEVKGTVRVSFQVRLWLLWGAVSLGPIIVLVLITANLLIRDHTLLALTVGVLVFGIFTGGLVFWVVANDMAGCLETHVAATHEIARENFAVRIRELRSDEWGRLTDSFNKMAHDLSLGRQVHETFGQFVGVDVETLQRYAQPGGTVQEITVLFADIRGFTRRAAGRPPGEVFELLNRFLSLSAQAIVENGGWVNKFLGDGFMALFGTPLPRDDHADCAVAAGCDLLRRLDVLNRDLEKQGQAPLRVGIGIHTGSALVGCVGAAIPSLDGRQRLEFTAIGATVNISQRLEELTKTCGAMLLFSDATRGRLQRPLCATCVGLQPIRGSEDAVVVYKIDDLLFPRGG